MTPRNSRSLLLLPAAALVLAIGALIAGCSNNDATTPTVTTTPTATDSAFLQLCGVLNAATAGELDVAQTTFDHGPLHALADEAIAIDRGVAARLLEAKEAVESDFSTGAPEPADLVADLEALAAATAAALVSTGAPVPPTCDLENP